MALPSPRTLLGPLTEIWTPPALCSINMAVCDTCTTGYQAQTCNPSSQAHDWTDCWPPRETSMPDPGVMMGWGLYSPGVICPAGYTTAAMATAGGSSGWDVEYSLTDRETAMACCPSGYSITFIEATSTIAQTCFLSATSTSFSTVQCNSGSFDQFSLVSLPRNGQSAYLLYAPLFQLNYRPEDLPETSTTTSAGLPTGPTTSASPGGSNTFSSSATSTTSSQTSGTPGPSPDPGSASGGLTSGAKIGIGVAVGVGALVLAVVAFLLFRSRRRRQAGAAAAAGDEKATSDEKAKAGLAQGAELQGEEVRELEAVEKTHELPTRLPSGRVPPQGPNYRISNQDWVVEPHNGAVFELEGDTDSFDRVR